MSEHSYESLEAVSARVWSARDSYLIPDSIALPFQYAKVVFLVKLRISALAQLHTCSRTYYITQTIAMIQTENICIKMGWDAFVYKWSVWNIMFHYCKAAKDIKNVKYLARYIVKPYGLPTKWNRGHSVMYYGGPDGISLYIFLHYITFGLREKNYVIMYT